MSFRVGRDTEMDELWRRYGGGKDYEYELLYADVERQSS